MTAIALALLFLSATLVWAGVTDTNIIDEFRVALADPKATAK